MLTNCGSLSYLDPVLKLLRLMAGTGRVSGDNGGAVCISEGKIQLLARLLYTGEGRSGWGGAWPT